MYISHNTTKSKLNDMKKLLFIFIALLYQTLCFSQAVDSSSYYLNLSNSLPKDKHAEKILLLTKSIEKSAVKNSTTTYFIIQNRIEEYISLKEYSLAENDYLSIIKSHETSPFFCIKEAYYGLANLYRDINKLDKAEEFYQKAFDSNSMMRINELFLYLDYSKYLTLIENYDSALANINMGLLSLSQGNPNVVTINYYKSEDNVAPEYFLLIFERALIYFKSEKKEEGCEELKYILSLDSGGDVFNVKNKASGLQSEKCK